MFHDGPVEWSWVVETVVIFLEGTVEVLDTVVMFPNGIVEMLDIVVMFPGGIVRVLSRCLHWRLWTSWVM